VKQNRVVTTSGKHRTLATVYIKPARVPEAQNMRRVSRPASAETAMSSVTRDVCQVYKIF
jgi:hypothetical protein